VAAGGAKPELPPVLDHTKSGTAELPEELGMMLNNKLQNCACAAYYHARQVWTFQTTGRADTEPNANVELLYEKACGYKPAEGGEGPGGVEQHVLRFLHTEGAPVGTDGKGREKIAAFFEIERRQDDVKRAIFECGVAYIGMMVPENVHPATGEPPPLWTVDPRKPKIVEGHAVILVGYDDVGFLFISWGRRYKMTWEFFTAYVDEAYAVADHAWMSAKGRSPAGLSAQQLEEQMRSLAH